MMLNTPPGGVAAHAGGDRRLREQAVGVVDLEVLLLDGNGDDYRALRLGRVLRRIRQLRRAVPEARARPFGPARRVIIIAIVRPEDLRLRGHGAGAEHRCRERGPQARGNPTMVVHA